MEPGLVNKRIYIPCWPAQQELNKLRMPVQKTLRKPRSHRAEGACWGVGGEFSSQEAGAKL